MAKSDKLVAELQKKFGEKNIGMASDMKLLDKRVSTGSLYLDWATGGGFPLGRIVELYGPFSTGKTLLGLLTIAQAQQQGLQCALLDAEKSFDEKHAQRLGVDTDKLLITQISEGETVGDIAIKLIEAKIDVVFIDSVSSLVPLVEIAENMEKATIGLQARLMSKLMRKMTAVNKKTLVIFANQLRMKIGSYGNPETTSGGESLGYYASIRIDVRRGDWLIDEKDVEGKKEKVKVGQVVKFTVSKSKVGQPQIKGYFKYIYNPPVIDRYIELIALAARTKVITKRGSWFDVLGESFHGKTGLEDRLRADETFFNTLKTEVLTNGFRNENQSTGEDSDKGSGMGEGEPEQPETTEIEGDDETNN